ncbi:HEPN domain-containing protein [Sphingomonas sp. H39-1-10]|uniref:HEPN domain-containing protein n=1 Tax=Sphingomonas pollutisoli TaxID=3030829 RepID=UPI0023B90CBF|nr:HEPN domain-containing protein [Sphingomonas pollutisoli]MDF0486497.1 HEPN domain-containing protein [Sphingomonas pollutisoli]
MIRRDYSRAQRTEGRVARGRSNGDTGRMNRTLDHLPAGKRRELAFVVDVLRETFAQECSTRQSPALRDGAVLKVVLYGSYARGDWVEDPVGRYFSDYDLLVVVADEAHTDVLEFWETAEKRLLDELSSGRLLRTPVSLIVHSLADVNDQLARGRYFFMDIVREGVVLFEEPGHPFVEPQPLALATALAEAEGYYEELREGAAAGLKGARFFISEGDLRPAAFQQHQAAESLYNGLLLVTTLYTPKSHNLVRLRKLTEPDHPELAAIWPTDTKFQKRCFELVRAAYVKARYSRHYRVTAEELAWMAERIEVLQANVVAICEARLASLRADESE